MIPFAIHRKRMWPILFGTHIVKHGLKQSLAAISTTALVLTTPRWHNLVSTTVHNISNIRAFVDFKRHRQTTYVARGNRRTSTMTARQPPQFGVTVLHSTLELCSRSTVARYIAVFWEVALVLSATISHDVITYVRGFLYIRKGFDWERHVTHRPVGLQKVTSYWGRVSQI